MKKLLHFALGALGGMVGLFILLIVITITNDDGGKPPPVVATATSKPTTVVAQTPSTEAVQHMKYKGNDVCWGNSSDEEISCTKLTQQMLLSMRGVNKEDVRKIMGEPGRLIPSESGPGFGEILHYISNYGPGKTGAGSLNVVFHDDHAVIVAALVDVGEHSGEIEFVWNAYSPLVSSNDEFDLSTMKYNRAFFCSDFPGSTRKCKVKASNEQDVFDLQLIVAREEWGTTVAQTERFIRAVCDMSHKPTSVSQCR